LRITEGTNYYRLRNRRFRKFEQEHENWTQHLEDLNTETECFGYAQCTHRQDGCSTEWRRVIVNRPKQQGDCGTRHFPASFIYTPLSPWNEASKISADSRDDKFVKEEIDEQAVLLAPFHPRVLASANLEHQEFLAHAQELHSKGMEEKDIAAQLNKELREKWRRGHVQANEGKDHIQVPPKITVREVVHTLNSIGLVGGLDGAQLQGSAEVPIHRFRI